MYNSDKTLITSLIDDQSTFIVASSEIFVHMLVPTLLTDQQFTLSARVFHQHMGVYYKKDVLKGSVTMDRPTVIKSNAFLNYQSQ